MKLFTEAVLAFSLRFQQLGLNLKENQVHASKEHRSNKSWSRNNSQISHFTLYLYVISAFEVHGNTYSHQSRTYSIHTSLLAWTKANVSLVCYSCKTKS
jgi:hypothetical protein